MPGKSMERQEKAEDKGDFDAQVASAMKMLGWDEKSVDKMSDDQKQGHNSLVSMESRKALTEAENPKRGRPYG